MLDNAEDMNTLARTNTVTSGPPVVTEHTAKVMLPPSAHDLQAQNVHAKGGQPTDLIRNQDHPIHKGAIDHT